MNKKAKNCLNKENIRKCDERSAWSDCTEMDSQYDEKYRYCAVKKDDWNKVDCWAANTLRYENGLKDGDIKALDEDVAGLSAKEWIQAPGPIRRVQTTSCFK